MLKLILKVAVVGAAGGVAHAAWRAWLQKSRAAEEAQLLCLHEMQWPVEQLARLDHDLRTPIGTIGNAVEWLRVEPLDSEGAQEAHEVIDRQVRRLTTLTSELHQLVVALEVSKRGATK